MFSLVDVPIYTPTHTVRGLSSLHTFCRIYCCRYFEMVIRIVVKCYLIGPLSCLSLRTNDSDRLFLYFMAVSIPSVAKCTFRSLVTFHWILYFLILSFMSCLYVWREIPCEYLHLLEFLPF